MPVYVHGDDVPLTRHPLRYGHERARTADLVTQPRALPIGAAPTRSGACRPPPVTEVVCDTAGTLAVSGAPRVVHPPGHTPGH